MTAREAAKNLIRGYVERGDSIESLADGCLGHAGSDYYASIGGYIWNGSHTDGTAHLVRKVGRYQIGVERLDGKDCHEVFSLKEIYNEILLEKQTGRKEQLTLF